MNNYDDIIKKYSILFEGISEQEPFALFGFECDVGWYNIIDNACRVICSNYNRYKRDYEYVLKNFDNFDDYVKKRRSFDKESSVEDIRASLEKDRAEHLSKMEAAAAKLPKIVQVKEKFGTLRFYIDHGNEVSNAVADYAETMSEVTCEKCGNSGKTYHMGWHKTLCPQHAVERYGEEKVYNYNNKS